MIDLLRNADILLFCCDVSASHIEARWVQIDPEKLTETVGTQQAVKIPKQTDSPEYLIEVPSDITAVHTDVRFSLIPVAS
jgi:hypothetical protein